jgi:glycosyltransferase involved in cell wall biosynthesis
MRIAVRGKIMRMGIILNYWAGWLGGATFFSALIKSLEQILPHEISLVLLDASVSKDRTISTNDVPIDSNLRLILDGLGRDQLDVVCSQEEWITSSGISVVGPSFGDVSTSVPRMSYIPDFQHKYYPSYFSDDEIASREVLYKRTLSQSIACVVNDSSVKDDILRFYPWFSGEVFVLPRYFAGLSDADLLKPLGRELCEDLVHPCDQYLVVCSQRWAHKRHDLVLKTFGNARHNLENLMLVFTGPRDDYRNTAVEEEFWSLVHDMDLSSSIIDLGRVDRLQQLSLINNAVALITASEFEGGVGAAGVEESVFLGTPVICPNTTLFDALGQDRNIFRHDFAHGDAQQFATYVSKAKKMGFKDRKRPDLVNMDQSVKASITQMISRFDAIVSHATLGRAL